MADIYITVLDTDEFCRVGDYLCLVKDQSNNYDDEAIAVYCSKSNSLEEILADSELARFIHDEDSDSYVANSVKTVAHGTYSAGRIYDKFNKVAFAKAEFVLRGAAICKFITAPEDEIEKMLALGDKRKKSKHESKD